MSSFAARQVAIILIAIALVLPRVCITSAKLEHAAHGSIDHTAQPIHCAHHDTSTPDHHGNSGSHDCCDQCTCCAAPTLAGPQVTPVKLLVAHGVVPYPIKGTAQRAELAKAVLKFNSHGPPRLS